MRRWPETAEGASVADAPPGPWESGRGNRAVGPGQWGPGSGARAVGPGPVYGMPSSKITYPPYQPEATAPVPSTAASTGQLSFRIATASAMSSGKAGSR